MQSFDTGMQASAIAVHNPGFFGLKDAGGTLFAVGLLNGSATMFQFTNIGTRTTTSVNTSTDHELSLTDVVAPTGLILAGTNGYVPVVADAAPGSTPASQPALHFYTELFGLLNSSIPFVTPYSSKEIMQSVAGGPVYGLNYQIYNLVKGGDRLYVTHGGATVSVFDRIIWNMVFGKLTSITSANRTITVQNATNLRGVWYDAASDKLIVSDAGVLGNGTDGAIYVINKGSTASGTVSPAITISGANTLLGDPLDVLLRANGSLYVAEAANGGGQILVFDNILSSSGGNVAPSVAVPVGTLGSSGAPSWLTLAPGAQ
ncbi:MAG: hypothetical protein P4L83_18950 [Nevskia sp.]|nr:hypothetical protein [Nevskia sp.]